MSTPTASTFPRSKAFARVALPLPLAKNFTYRVPDELRDKISVGSRVEVPFGKRVLSGIVMNFAEQTDLGKTRPIRRLYETFLPQDLLKLAEWMASYYGCTVGEAAQSVLPPVLRSAKIAGRLRGSLVLAEGVREDERESALARAPRQRALLERLARTGGAANIETIRRWGFSSSHIKALLDRGMAGLRPERGDSALASIEAPVLKLNAGQKRAMDAIREDLARRCFAPMLLHGITGSGKTELYIRTVEQVHGDGGGCIVLVPEIGLLPQATVRYRSRFGAEIAILHSRLTGPERFAVWKRIVSGECRIVLGPRSTVFSPVKNLRLIIVDEEQDDSYKQDDKPRYHARSVALMRGKLENLAVILGSATPSAESLHQARSKRYRYLSLPERAGGATLPDIQFVDMREAAMEGALFSSRLIERIDWNIQNGHQVILFLNKRGHARFVQCNACGWTARCGDCDISLTYHRVDGRLRCHYCGFNRAVVQRCQSCGSTRLYYGGVGTQRVELDLQGFFPGIGILRMDADTTSGKDGHLRVLEKFGGGDYPVLIGTQMVTKGHHFPGVNLVGVLFAEESLNYPDFRAAERTFRQLVQVAGRAGRAGRGGRAGEVIVQTCLPEHQVFRCLKQHDYKGFMKEELAARRRLRYPPFSRIILASCSAPDRDVLERVVRVWADRMRRRLAGKSAEVLGPVPPLVARIKNRFREQVVIKGRLSGSEKMDLLADFRRVVDREPGGRSVDMRWDVDPESFL